MLGTIVNAASIVLGSLFGIIFKKLQKYQAAISGVIGLSVTLLGASGTIGGLLKEDTNVLLFFLSLIIGTIIGEILNIEGRFQKFGDFLGMKFGGSDKFSKGFITATLIFVVGSMSILGAIEDGLTGDHTLLFAKSILDGVTSVMLAATYGIGVAFSAICVFVYQGAIALSARVVSPYIIPISISALSTVGNAIIVAIGLDMLNIKKLSYANMLPAVFLPLLYYLPAVQNLVNTR